MTAQVTRFGGRADRAGRPGAANARLPGLALSALLALSAPAQAQFFGDRPPPVPPASVPLPEGVGGGAINLAPPSGPAAAPAFPPSVLSPPIGAAPAPAI